MLGAIKFNLKFLMWSSCKRDIDSGGITATAHFHLSPSEAALTQMQI